MISLFAIPRLNPGRCFSSHTGKAPQRELFLGRKPDQAQEVVLDHFQCFDSRVFHHGDTLSPSSILKKGK